MVGHTLRPAQTKNVRHVVLLYMYAVIMALVVGRLWYWQVYRRDELQADAQDQYQRRLTSSGHRGRIFTSDGYALVSNERIYRLFAEPHQLQRSPSEIALELAPLLADDPADQSASTASQRAQKTIQLQNDIQKKLDTTSAKWVNLKTPITEAMADKIKEKKIAGLGFEPLERRLYPEASMAAQLTGFVGKNDSGEDVGYFGVEGALDKELRGRLQKMTVFADALGQPLTSESSAQQIVLDGRDVTLTLRRDMQHIAEKALAAGLEKYGAESGEIVILDPKTGALLALATLPSFDQRNFSQFPGSTYGNPSLNAVYEPGSTFKVLTVAAGINEKKITPDTICTRCSGPRVFGKYTIKTWNEVYNPDISMRDVLAKSDNTAMIFIAEQLGAETLKKYLQAFGIGEPLNISLQGDRKTPFPQKWGPVELATISFGQGVGTTSLQMVRAFAVIANRGLMMRPYIIQEVFDPVTNEKSTIQPIQERQVITPEAAATMTEMMIASAQHGEAQWTASRLYTVAGKTGTAQVAQAGGGYEEDTTVASFIGFAPAYDPQFVMAIKLTAPQTSPWAAETAAPLWYSVANQLFLLLGIAPDKTAPTTTPSTPAPVGD